MTHWCLLTHLLQLVCQNLDLLLVLVLLLWVLWLCAEVGVSQIYQTRKCTKRLRHYEYLSMFLPSLPGPPETSGCSAQFSAPPQAQSTCCQVMVWLNGHKNTTDRERSVRKNKNTGEVNTKKSWREKEGRLLPLRQLSALFCALQVTLNDHELTGHLKSQHMKFSLIHQYTWYCNSNYLQPVEVIYI